MSKNGTVTIPIVEYDLLRDYYKNHPKAKGTSVVLSNRPNVTEVITYFSDDKEVLEAITTVKKMISDDERKDIELRMLRDQNSILQDEIEDLRNRGFWARLFNVQ